MLPEHLEIVQQTMTVILVDAEETSRVFYRRLFEIDPSTRELFADDVTAQGMKFMTTLAHITHMLNRPEMMVDLVQELGRDHAGYGVREEHYESLKAALLWTLAESLGDDFTPLVGAAWSEAYDSIATVMRGAASAGTQDTAPST